MVVANRGDDRNQGVRHIRRVQSSTQANFQYGMLDMLATEIQKGQGCCQFIGDKWAKAMLRGELFNQNAHLSKKRGHLLFADQLSIDTNALAKGVQVWLCIKAGTQGSFAQDSFNEGGGGTFTFCASDQRA